MLAIPVRGEPVLALEYWGGVLGWIRSPPTLPMYACVCENVIYTTYAHPRNERNIVPKTSPDRETNVSHPLSLACGVMYVPFHLWCSLLILRR